MKSKTRYTLLAGCITIFIVATPLIIIFVSGYRYNPVSRSFSQTGAISAKTDPEGARLTINGKKVGSTPDIARFLSTGVYQTSLSLPGYFTWTKNLAVFSQDVTLTHLGYNAVTMFFSVPIIKQIPSPQPILGFTGDDNDVVYANAKTVYESRANALTTVIASAALPTEFAGASSITITSSPADDYFLLTTANGDDQAQAIFVPSEQKIYPLNILVTANSWQFGEHGDLFALQGQNLISVNWQSGGNATVIASSVIGFTWHDSYLYILVHDNAGSVLEQVNTDGSGLVTLYSGLPVWQKVYLYLNQVNQIAILGDGTLYSLSPKLQAIESYVSGVSPESGTNELFYYTKNEIGVFDPSTNSLQPITRTSEVISDSGISVPTGWAFYTAGGLLQIIEMDTRGNQNVYQLLRVSADASFTVDSNAKYIFLLQDGNLEQLQIR